MRREDVRNFVYDMTKAFCVVDWLQNSKINFFFLETSRTISPPARSNILSTCIATHVEI